MKKDQFIHSVAALSSISIIFTFVKAEASSFRPKSHIRSPLSQLAGLGHCPAFIFHSRSNTLRIGIIIQQDRVDHGDAPLSPRGVEGQRSSPSPLSSSLKDHSVILPSTPKNTPRNHNHVRHTYSSKYHRAVHQAEHRAKEKAVFGIAEHVTDQVSKVAEKGISQHFGERVVKETGERMVERAAERTGTGMVAKMGERVGERAIERTGEHLAERVAERGAERAVERAGMHVGSEAATRIFDRSSERLGERLGERIFGRGRGERSLEKIGERVAERGSERVLEKAGQHVGSETAASVLDRSSKRLGDRLRERLVGCGREEIALGRTIERSGEKLAVRVAENGAERLVVRLTKGLLVALPALGGLFALYLLMSDIERMKEEWPYRIKSSLFMFAGATAADLVDMFLHFFIVAGLLAHRSHHNLVVAEKLSLSCALISSVCAVVGEIVSFNVRQRKEAQNTLKT